MDAVNHDVTPPERIIQTFGFEELSGDRTKMTARAVFLSVEDRDGMLQSGYGRGDAGIPLTAGQTVGEGVEGGS